MNGLYFRDAKRRRRQGCKMSAQCADICDCRLAATMVRGTGLVRSEATE